ncbi:AI-2E family transporter [Eisenibacter elegans]|jgi:predicted PurR-regulated permease PerM|uniref:AI-2E family transporter n=1 Tax=Eisenibacter elegans TaxID=997 RepID=UPI0003FA8262|nr:AI-2E family transporter [Eisenibacter elegans]
MQIFKTKFFWGILLLSLAAWIAFWLFRDIVVYLLISLILAFILRPLTDRIDDFEFFRLKLPRFMAVFLSFSVLIGFLALVSLLFIPLVTEQVEALYAAQAKIQENPASLDRVLKNSEKWLRDNVGVTEPDGFLLESIRSFFTGIFDYHNIGGLLNNLLNITGTVFIYLLAISFITFFLLYEKGILRRNMLALVPNAYFEVVITTVYKIEHLLSNYLAGLLLQILAMFSIISVGLYIVGAKYALTIALFGAVINLIPYLGPALGFLFSLLVSYTIVGFELSPQEYLFLTLKNAVVFGIAQFTDNVFLQPLIFSKSVKAHPLEIFIVIFAGASIAGAVGMIAAIPVYTILRVSAIEFSKGYRHYYIFRVQRSFLVEE